MAKNWGAWALAACVLEAVLLLLLVLSRPSATVSVSAVGPPPPSPGVASSKAATPAAANLRRDPPFSDIWFTAFARVMSRGTLRLNASQKAAVIEALRQSGNPRRTYEAVLVSVIRTLTPEQMQSLRKTLLTRVPVETLKPFPLPSSTPNLNARWVQTFFWVARSIDVEPAAVQPAVTPTDTTSQALSGIPSLPQHWILSFNYALRSGDIRLSRAQAKALLPVLAAAVEADRTEYHLRQTLDRILDADQRQCIAQELMDSEVGGLVVMDTSGPRISDADQFLSFVLTVQDEPTPAH